ncbi:hypothetical protein [Micromonospora gifhornensis]|nr:hypothetical protein [Micromonospora gifhornensis]
MNHRSLASLVAFVYDPGDTGSAGLSRAAASCGQRVLSDIQNVGRDGELIVWCSDGARMFGTLSAQSRLFQHGSSSAAC